RRRPNSRGLAGGPVANGLRAGSEGGDPLQGRAWPGTGSGGGGIADGGLAVCCNSYELFKPAGESASLRGSTTPRRLADSPAGLEMKHQDILLPARGARKD